MLIRETFEAAEENRGSSLRALVARPPVEAADLPPSYWESLGRLQRAEIQALRAPGPVTLPAAARARAELARKEMEIPGGMPPPSDDLLERACATLDGDTALLTFQTGESVSWLWSLDREGLALHQLPPRHEIEAMAERFSTATRNGSGDAVSAGVALYHILFGGLDARTRGKTHWLLTLDRGLFEAPLAAISTDGRFLAETHVIQTIPGVGAWVDAASRPQAKRSALFVGVGDAIYNTADQRRRHGQVPVKDTLQLPRLVASAREVEACAGLWKGDRVLLEGEDASRDNLRRELARDPAVVHLATHILESSGPEPQGLIALSLTPRLENELLPPQEIAGWRTGAELVVVSGCHSALAPALPGTGMLGLTRAWLAAGARTVIASNWATPDETGSLFRALYRNLSANANLGPSAALRAAQLEMIHSGDWRALPRYWGAYFAVGVQ